MIVRGMSDPSSGGSSGGVPARRESWETRMSSEDLRPEEVEMVKRMIEFSQRNPHHRPWEHLVRVCREATE